MLGMLYAPPDRETARYWVPLGTCSATIIAEAGAAPSVAPTRPLREAVVTPCAISWEGRRTKTTASARRRAFRIACLQDRAARKERRLKSRIPYESVKPPVTCRGAPPRGGGARDRGRLPIHSRFRKDPSPPGPPGGARTLRPAGRIPSSGIGDCRAGAG